ncbi:MAG: alpha/beta hydrolase [Pseudomonadota bacterium]
MVFIHGLGGSSEDWQQQVASLAPGYSILTLDNRGHGASRVESNSASYSVPAMVEDLKSVLDHLSIKRCHLVGHSIGGAVAQELAHARPAGVISLTLVGTTDWFGDHDQPGGKPPYIPKNLRELSQQRVERMGTEVLKQCWAGLLAWHGSREWIHTVTCKTLVLLGSLDASRIVEGSQRLAGAIDGAKLVYIDKVGHSPHLEAVDAFTKTLIEFLQGLGRGP